MRYKSPAMERFSRRFRLTRNRTISPIPALVHRPEMTAAKDIALFKYSSVSRTEAAQFGIKPMIAVKKGCRILPFNRKVEMASIPASVIRRFKIPENTKRYPNSRKVWLRAGFRMP